MCFFRFRGVGRGASGYGEDIWLTVLSKLLGGRWSYSEEGGHSPQLPGTDAKVPGWSRRAGKCSGTRCISPTPEGAEMEDKSVLEEIKKKCP